MSVCDQEANIVALYTVQYNNTNISNHNNITNNIEYNTYISCFASHDNKLFCSLHQESCEFVTENLFDFIRLFYLNRNSNRVN